MKPNRQQEFVATKFVREPGVKLLKGSWQDSRKRGDFDAGRI